MSDLIPWMAPWSGRIVVAALILIALLFAWRMLSRPRTKHARCPKCRYDRAHRDSLTCPECGHTARDERDLVRRPRRWRWGVLCLLIAIGTPTYVAARRINQYGWDYYLRFGPGYWLFGHYTIVEVVIGNSRIRIYGDRDPFVYYPIAEVTYRGNVVEQPERMRRDSEWSIGCDDDHGHRFGIGNERFSNGDPLIVLVESRYRDAEHNDCMWNILRFYRMTESGSWLVQRFDNGEVATLKDVDGDGFPEILTVDQNWEPEAPAFPGTNYTPPPIVLAFDPDLGRFELATRFMRASLPSADELAQRIADAAAWGNPDRMWSLVLELIYTGHADVALPLPDRYWNPDWGGREWYVNRFRATAESSPYWNEVLQMSEQ